MSSVLILGIGNVLLSDEGIGVHMARTLLSEGGLPEGAEVVDGGTMGLELLPLLENAASLLIIDAVELGAAPGALRVIVGRHLETTLSLHVSPHQVGAADLIAVARMLGRLPQQTSLLGVQPASLSPGAELSAALRPRLDSLTAVAREEAWRLATEAASA
jgi:hydrogenase maturation protease